MTIICVLGFVFVPLFGVVDYLIAREHFIFLITLRIICGVYCFVCFLWVRSKHALFFATYFGWSPLLLVGLTIAAMVRVLGGYQSPYYAGLNLVILIIGLMASWTFWETAALSLVILFSYLIPSLIFDDIEGIGLFVLYNFFLLTTAIFAIVSHYFRNRLEYSNFASSLEINEKNQQLERLDKSKSNFLATISHELKTPMTLIVNPIEAALADQKEGKIQLDRQDAEIVRRNTYRLATMVGDLLEISRGDVGKKQLVPSEVPDVKKHFQELFEGMKPLFEEKGIKAEFIAGRPGSPPPSPSPLEGGGDKREKPPLPLVGEGWGEGELAPHYFDIKKIDKVISNLLSNALKFTPKGGEVRVQIRDRPAGDSSPAAQNDKPFLEITVSDTGIGIPKDKIDKVFERFVQVEEGSTRSYEGMGIGLSLVKDFVEQHGGNAEVKSEVGKGSVFTVALPRGKGHFTVPIVETDETHPTSEQKFDFTRELMKERLSEAPSNTEPMPFESGRKTILVVEDNADVRQTIQRTLSVEYNIVHAQNGQEGLQRVQEVRPDTIITDIMMPVMDGYQMIREIRKEERFKDLPVIVLTAKSGEEGLAEGFESGANDYLTKPFSSSELKLRVRNHLEKQELKAEVVRQQNLASVGTLSAGISHNMNTYAITVDTGLSLAKAHLREQELPSAARNDIMQGLMGAKEGLESIRNMIEALEVYSQKNIEGFKEDNLAQTTMSVIEMAKTKAPLSVVIDFDSPRLVPCYFNAHLLNPAIMNLIINAIDACKKCRSGAILLSLSNGSDDTILLTVKDNGHGIPLEIQHRIWDPYFTTKDVGSGTGLGLWMVRRAVELDHGGKVWFETSPEGTIFFVRLPKKGGHHGKQPTEKNSLH